jgi:glyoxylase-like metal-dependent hydrolase (beta-lactamase superfamily II)
MNDITMTSRLLDYPCGTPPEGGVVLPVADGVFWIRMPLPFPPTHINMWLLRDGGGWTVVDTGIRSSKVQGLWNRIFATALDGKPITRLICTHFHPDHSGLAGWLGEHWQAPLWMSQAEWLNGRLQGADALPAIPGDVLAYYERAGYSERMMQAARTRTWDNFAKLTTPLPRAYRRITDGEALAIDGRAWQVIVGYGHAPEHACLYCPDLQVMISGDQILPRISPHVGVTATEPEANPLGAYVASLGSFEPLPPETLVLPSHGEPFRGLHARIAYLRAHHAERLDAVEAACAEPRGTAELLPVMFRRELQDAELGLAFNETLAHIHLLIGQGRMAREIGANGVYCYRRIA